MTVNLSKYVYSDARGERSDILPSLNRSALARDMGISRSQLSRILAGDIEPPLKTVERLAEAAGASLDETVQWLRELRAKQKKSKQRRRA